MSLNKFSFNNDPVRVVLIDNDPWFIAKDVCMVLGLENVSQALSGLDESERGIISNDAIGEQSFTKYTLLTISESGFYDLVLTSRKPQAKPFKRWVTSEVLPTIRKTGVYTSTPKTYSEALRELADQHDKTEQLTKQLKETAPKVEFYDAVTGSDNTMDMLEVSKILGTGRNRLFAFLRDQKILLPNKENLPYQSFIDAGYFKVIETRFNKPDGTVHIGRKTVVYQKGVDFIQKRLKKFAK
jgi:anti-repressor protein